MQPRYRETLPATKARTKLVCTCDAWLSRRVVYDDYVTIVSCYEGKCISMQFTHADIFENLALLESAVLLRTSQSFQGVQSPICHTIFLKQNLRHEYLHHRLRKPPCSLAQIPRCTLMLSESSPCVHPEKSQYTCRRRNRIKRKLALSCFSPPVSLGVASSG